MAKKKKLSIQDEQNRVGSGETTSEPTPSATRELLELKLSDEQRRTILKYAELPAHLSERLATNRAVATRPQFTLDELDELLDHVETSVYRAKGNEKQKVLRIVEKVSELLGSTIDPDQMSDQRLPKETNAVFQIKVTLMGIAPLIWRRVQTQDCTLADLHDLLQVTMGWDSEHLYRFIIGGVEYADLSMASDDDAQDVCETNLSDILPAHNRRPRFHYLYDFGDQWMHQLIVEERFPPEQGVKYPICMAGQRACPPEDCGGPWGYPDFVETISNADHRGHEETLEWVGGEFDPEKFDLESVNKELRRMRKGKS
jgi:Plasmid pRiA4b ORF-3-like protein